MTYPECELCHLPIQPGEQSEPRTKPDGKPEHVHDACLAQGCCGLHMAHTQS